MASFITSTQAVKGFKLKEIKIKQSKCLIIVKRKKNHFPCFLLMLSYSSLNMKFPHLSNLCS